jgi:hypothetical protein
VNVEIQRTAKPLDQRHGTGARRVWANPAFLIRCAAMTRETMPRTWVFWLQNPAKQFAKIEPFEARAFQGAVIQIECIDLDICAHFHP